MSPTSQPIRGIAVLFAFIGPMGTGHLYLGQKRRAVLWFVLPPVLTVLTLLVATLVQGSPRFSVSFGIVLSGAVGSWLASLIDLFRIRKERYASVGALPVVLFWLGGFFIASIGVPMGLRMFVMEAFKIPSGAMVPTLLVGDHIFADKLVYRTRDPKRGEPIIFQFPEKPEQDFVKRVIAGPGDLLLVRGGHPWINGWEVPHCLVGRTKLGETTGELFVEFLEGEAYLTLYDDAVAADPSRSEQGPYVVALGEYWVLGDNRHNSHDSRMWFDGRGGGVPRKLVRALGSLRWLSMTESGMDSSRFGTSLADPLLPREARSLDADLKRCMNARPSVDATIPPLSLPKR